MTHNNRHCELKREVEPEGEAISSRPSQVVASTSIQALYVYSRMQRGGCVYIMTNKHHSVLYTGVTSDLLFRVMEHKEHRYPNSFTARYKVVKLVYYNGFFSIEEAIAEEKRIKGGSRLQKINLINSMNPNWNDLWEEVSKW